MKHLPGLAIDRQPAHVGIEDMDVEHTVIDQLGEQPAFGQGLADPLLKVFIELLQRMLGPAAFGDILEQHRHLAALRRLDAKT